jgi:hypothetical protein
MLEERRDECVYTLHFDIITAFLEERKPDYGALEGITGSEKKRKAKKVRLFVINFQ